MSDVKHMQFQATVQTNGYNVFSVSIAGKGWFTALKVTEVTPLFPQAIFMALYYTTSYLVFIIYQLRSEGITHFPAFPNAGRHS
jgi:hypothetical protein